MSIPVEKIHKAKTLLDSMINAKKGKVTVHQVQSLCGFLNFIGRCILPGRAFTRHLYTLIANPNLLPHHHIKVPVEIKKDLIMWRRFVDHPSAYSRPFMDYSATLQATEIDFYTDASGKIGVGGVWGTAWFAEQWPEWFLDCEPSIASQELYGVVAAVLAWMERFHNKRVVIFCDNQSTVTMVNRTSSACGQCMKLIRILVLHCLMLNVRVFAHYVNTKLNIRADLLSRNKLDVFKCQFSHDVVKTQLHPSIWPIDNIWLK